MTSSPASKAADQRYYDRYYERNEAYILRRNAQYRRSLGFSWLWRNHRHLAWQLIRKCRLKQR